VLPSCLYVHLPVLSLPLNCVQFPDFSLSLNYVLFPDLLPLTFVFHVIQAPMTLELSYAIKYSSDLTKYGIRGIMPPRLGEEEQGGPPSVAHSAQIIGPGGIELR
jgi:hypothetical protein